MPECKDPITGKEGYEPFCPPGYFRCCATCKGAVCYSEEGLHRSWRGIKECIRCAPGDFCAGCDTYERCRLSEVKGREGPKIAPAGSTRGQDCEICPTGYEADLKRERCVKKWSDECNTKYVARCTRNCYAEDPKRMKNLNFCERMKCEMFCANLWSSSCAARFKLECEYRKNGPNDYDLYSPDEEWLMDCDVDCNGAQYIRLSTLALIWSVACLLSSFLRNAS